VTKETNDPQSLLPLPPVTFQILAALAEGERHGYALIQALGLQAGTLYRSIQRMLEQGLVAESRVEDFDRRRTYKITAFGRAVAQAEARRLAQMVKLARQAGFVPGGA
jgi:DNA-binding PadR family transcriptional regulator